MVELTAPNEIQAREFGGKLGERKNTKTLGFSPAFFFLNQSVRQANPPTVMRQKLVLLISVVIALACWAYDPDDFRDPPALEPAFYARAEIRSFRGFVQVHKPGDVARRQHEKKLLVDAECSYICHVVAEPTPFPADTVKAISKGLFTGTPEAKAQIMNGPIMGPFTAFVLYDKHRKPMALVFQQLSVYMTFHVREVSGDDMYQRIGDWIAYSYCPEFDAIVGIATNPYPTTQTPFLKWRNQMK